MALLNVRLEAEDSQRVSALRDAGVVISTLVRDAIRAEYDKRVPPRLGKRKPSQVVAEIIQALPDDEQAPARAFAITDRQALRRHVAAKLRGSPR